MSNITSTFMERLCHEIHPKMESSTLCGSWFLHAAKHCERLIKNSARRRPMFWEILIDIMFPKKPMLGIHPNNLALHECDFLYHDIVNDYMLQARRFSIESIINSLLWQILYCQLILITFRCILLAVIKLRGRYHYKKEIIPEARYPQMCSEEVVGRNLRMARMEVPRVKVLLLTKPETLFTVDGSASMVITIYSKFTFLDLMEKSSLAATSYLYRLNDPSKKFNIYFKWQSIESALKLMGSDSKKLRLLVIEKKSHWLQANVGRNVCIGDSHATILGSNRRSKAGIAFSGLSVINKARGIPHNARRCSPANKK